MASGDDVRTVYVLPSDSWMSCVNVYGRRGRLISVAAREGVLEKCLGEADVWVFNGLRERHVVGRRGSVLGSLVAIFGRVWLVGIRRWFRSRVARLVVADEGSNWIGSDR
jgi:hypothetical protein